VGSLNEELHYAMDVDLWFSIIKVAQSRITDRVLSVYRFQENANTIKNSLDTFKQVIYLVKNKF